LNQSEPAVARGIHNDFLRRPKKVLSLGKFTGKQGKKDCQSFVRQGFIHFARS
jgi:hypothetical protein